MSVDFDAVANAIASRFSSTNVTAPSGETNIRLSTASLPDAVTAEPTVLVFPPTSIELHYTTGTRSGVASYPVRFYIYRIRDSKRNAVLINKWIGALYSQLDGQVHLGLSDYVTHAVVSEMHVGSFHSGSNDFHGIELIVEVHVWEGLAAVA